MSEENKIKSADELKLELQKKYADLAKNSLLRVQYSCSGNSCDVDENDFNESVDEETINKCENQ